MIRVFLVDDHAILRAGVAALIQMQPDMRCVGEASGGQEALAALRKCEADVVLVDLEMPGCNGFETIKLLCKDNPELRPIALTAHKEQQHVDAARAAGARAYVAKHVADRQLLYTIRQVVSGTEFVCLVGEVQEEPVEGTIDKGMLAQLSTREVQVLQLLVLGHTNKEVAAALGIGTKSVETYRSRVSQKTKLKTRAELVQFAFETGMLQQLLSRFPDLSNS